MPGNYRTKPIPPSAVPPAPKPLPAGCTVNFFCARKLVALLRPFFHHHDRSQLPFGKPAPAGSIFLNGVYLRKLGVVTNFRRRTVQSWLLPVTVGRLPADVAVASTDQASRPFAQADVDGIKSKDNSRASLVTRCTLVDCACSAVRFCLTKSCSCQRSGRSRPLSYRRCRVGAGLGNCSMIARVSGVRPCITHSTSNGLRRSMTCASFAKWSLKTAAEARQ